MAMFSMILFCFVLFYSLLLLFCQKATWSDPVIHKEAGTTQNSSPPTLRKPNAIVFEALIFCFLVASFDVLTSPYTSVSVSSSESLHSFFSLIEAITGAFIYEDMLYVHDVIKNWMETHLFGSKTQNPWLYWNSTSLSRRSWGHSRLY